ncbi:MAG TPA: CHAT domain-containing protein, partial [Polyangium sp.]|nr:CHAT domain-containing protein [Polyangium sp.]
HEIPYAVLPFEGKHLVQRFNLRVLPHAAMVLRPSVSTKAQSPAAIFYYAGDNPTNALQRIREEADQVGGLYGVTPIEAPNRGTLLQALETFDIVHFIVHGRTQSSATSSLAHIDLPATQSDNGDLEVTHVLLHPRPLSARIAVLASCELGMGRRSPGDDGVGLARVLLQKGVGAVIAPLWAIGNGKETRDMAEYIHQGLRAGKSAHIALADAQRSAIGKMLAGYWSPFIVVGGAP